jgi:hypothetical protein
MSIATLKKKTMNQYNTLSVGTKGGFSLNGTHRSQGYIGQSTQSRFLSRTLMKGDTVRGHGACCGKYPTSNIVQTSVTSTENPNVVKPSVLGTRGMISKKYRWVLRPQPFSTTDKTDSHEWDSQSHYVQSKSTRIQTLIQQCNDANPIKDIPCRESCPKSCRPICSNNTNYNQLSNKIIITKPHPTGDVHKQFLSQSAYIENKLRIKCSLHDIMRISTKTQKIPFACANAK